MEQLLAHLTGDYLLQSKWMAENKHNSAWVALLHGLVYSLPFLFITTNPATLLLIGTSHAIIDHKQLALYFVWAKDQFAPKSYRQPWSVFYKNFPDKPDWLFVWLKIIIDNSIHLIINYLAIKYV